MLSGEVLNKALRLKGQHIQGKIPATQINTEINNVIAALPVWANSMAGAIDLGVGVSLLWHYIGPTSLVCFVSFLSTKCLNKKLLTRLTY